MRALVTFCVALIGAVVVGLMLGNYDVKFSTGAWITLGYSLIFGVAFFYFLVLDCTDDAPEN